MLPGYGTISCLQDRIETKPEGFVRFRPAHLKEL